MKKRRFAQLVLMITMLFCLTFGTVCAQAATTATTTTAKAAVKNGWKKEGGKYYGFNRYAQMVKGVYYSAYGQSRAGFYAFNTKTGVYDARTSSRIWTVHFLQQTEIRSKFLQTTKIQPV